jgi:hypothetical protein
MFINSEELTPNHIEAIYPLTHKGGLITVHLNLLMIREKKMEALIKTTYLLKLMIYLNIKRLS